MHGMIHTALKRFVGENHGTEAWNAILEEAGLSERYYFPKEPYPDEEAGAIVAAASKLTGAPADDILESFGEYLVPVLMKMYGSLLKPDWGTLEMLLHTEGTIHRVLRMKDPEVKPPKLEFEQTGPSTLTLNYSSKRRMSGVARGMIKGVAEHYGDQVTISETPRPDGSCVMKVQVH